MAPAVAADYKWILSTDQLKYYRVNGSDVTYDGNSTNVANSSTGPTGLGISNFLTEQSNWQFLDMIAFNRELNNGEIRLIENYLSRIYGLSLTGENEDQLIGINIIRTALEAPLRIIVQNAGLEGSVVLNKVREGKGDAYGFNARENKYEEDLYKAGIIDPTKVTRLALENAASISGLLLTTECVIADDPEDKEPAMPGGGGGMGGMM
jgi:hypothetical protein